MGKWPILKMKINCILLLKKKKGEKNIYILRILTGLPKGESLYCASVLAVGGGDSKTTLVISKI